MGTRRGVWGGGGGEDVGRTEGWKRGAEIASVQPHCQYFIMLPTKPAQYSCSLHIGVLIETRGAGLGLLCVCVCVCVCMRRDTKST